MRAPVQPGARGKARGERPNQLPPGDSPVRTVPARQMMLDNAPEFRLEVSSSPERYFSTFGCDDAVAGR